MAELVYLLGAGVNQGISWRGTKPPLATNFFQVASRSEKFTNEMYMTRIAPVYDYISQHWGMSRDDLQNKPFNIEDLFTFLQLEMDDANRLKDRERHSHAASVNYLLVSFLAEYLSEFELAPVMSEVMRRFGETIYHEQPTILTFNYDCIVEELLKSASGVNVNPPQSFLTGIDTPEEIPYDELPYSHHNWNIPLAYGIRFDQVQLQRAGLSTYTEGKRFYGHPKNQIYPWKILKLHGSLNWFRYVPVRKYLAFSPSEEKLPEEKLEEVLLLNGHWWFAEPPDFHGWYIEPLIITPVLYKAQFFEHPLFSNIWSQARTELSGCKRLVIIGYSFAPSDFHTKKLLLDAFHKEPPEDLVIINPDARIVNTIKELTRFKKPVLLCKDMEEYLISHNK